MSNIKRAQKIVNELDTELGITLVAYQNSELELLRNRLNEFLDLDISTDDLVDADEADDDDEGDLQDLEDASWEDGDDR